MATPGDEDFGPEGVECEELDFGKTEHFWIFDQDAYESHYIARYSIPEQIPEEVLYHPGLKIEWASIEGTYIARTQTKKARSSPR